MDTRGIEEKVTRKKKGRIEVSYVIITFIKSTEETIDVVVDT